MKHTTITALFLLAACSSGSDATTSLSTGTPPATTAPASSETGLSTSGTSTSIEGTSGSTLAPLDASSSGGQTSSGAPIESTSTSGVESSTSMGSSSTSVADETSGSSSEGSTGPAPVCGDGLIDAGEECDEAEGNAADALCTPECLFAVCGDAYVFPDEEVCDDGNALNTDACLDNCGAALCGDGFVWAGVEPCDDGNLVNDDLCSDACVSATCEDAAKNGEETSVDCGGPTCKACSVPGLVINEVDYDTHADAADLAEFIEIANTTDAPIDLAGHAVMLVNGNGMTTYTTIDLAPAGFLAAGQYLVLAAPAVIVAPDALKIAIKAGGIQNGSPDGIALVDKVKGVVLDALSYEGSMFAVQLPGFDGPVSLVEGDPCEAEDNNLTEGSLSRVPNGYDANNAATDWVFSAHPTPGAANKP